MSGLADQQINKKLPLLGVQDLPLLPSARPELFIGFDAEQQEQARCFVCSVKRDEALF